MWPPWQRTVTFVIARRACVGLGLALVYRRSAAAAAAPAYDAGVRLIMVGWVWLRSAVPAC